MNNHYTPKSKRMKTKQGFLEKSNEYLINSNHIIKDKRNNKQKGYKLTSFIIPETKSSLNKIKVNVNKNNSKEKFFKVCKISPKGKSNNNWNSMCNKYLQDIIKYNNNSNKKIISKNIINKKNLSVIKSGSFKNLSSKDNYFLEKNKNDSFQISSKFFDNKNKSIIINSKNKNKLIHKNKSTNLKTIKVNTTINNDNIIQQNRNENIQNNKNIQKPKSKLEKVINNIKTNQKLTHEENTNTSEKNKKNITNILNYDKPKKIIKQKTKDYEKLLDNTNFNKVHELYNEIRNNSNYFNKINKEVLQEIKNNGFVESKEKYYEIGDIIGKGNFGKVYLAKQILTNTDVAIKIISKNTIKKKENKNKVELEIKLLRLAFGNNYIIKLLEYFENEENIFLVFEYCPNGDILKYIKKKGVMNEIQAMRIIYQILLGLEYLHNNNIFHRDIKLDNILLGNKMKCKIGDFGISLYKNKNDIIKDTAGTPAYLAPEILKARGKADFKSDIWSLGVFLFAIIFGTMPFKSKNVQEVYQLILKGKFKFPDNITCSNSLYDIITKMLTYNIENRPSVKEVLKHNWFQKEYINDLDKENQLLLDINSLDQNNVLICKYLLSKFGFKYDYIEESLKDKKMNHCTSCFYTLYNKLN